MTRLMHASGQWIEGETPILNKDNNPQAFGSAMTYAKRYALAAIVGVATDDDDGQVAMREPSAPSRYSPPTAATPPARASSGPAPASDDASVDPAHTAVAEHLKKGVHELGDICQWRGGLEPELEALAPISICISWVLLWS